MGKLKQKKRKKYKLLKNEERQAEMWSVTMENQILPKIEKGKKKERKENATC